MKHLSVIGKTIRKKFIKEIEDLNTINKRNVISFNLSAVLTK